MGGVGFGSAEDSGVRSAARIHGMMRDFFMMG